MSAKQCRILFISGLLGVLLWGFLLKSFFIGGILILALLIHEYGHYVQMGREGLERRSMIVIPGLGALAITKDPWQSFSAEARIALAGPFFGIFAGVLLWCLGYATHEPIFFAGATISGIINLFNLLPVLPLDGGRCIRAVLASFHFHAQIVSFVISIAFTILLMRSHPLLAVVFFLFFLRPEFKRYLWAGFQLPKFEAELVNIRVNAPEELKDAEEAVAELRRMRELPKMKLGGIALALIGYGCIAALHLGIMILGIQSMDALGFDMKNLGSYF